MWLDQIEQKALAAGVIDEGESRYWQASLHRNAALNGFFVCANGVTLAGRKP
jgi:hypothetical protein